MSKKTNNLVEIAKILIELKEERELHGVPASVTSRYPEGSLGILINEEKFIVLNNATSNVVSTSDQFNTLKDANLKYNPNFYLSTHECDEPDIIDEAHNKSKLISQAYTEVSFLPKDIYSQAVFDPEEGKSALRSIIDRSMLNALDFEDYRVEKPTYSSGNVFDEIYRCRCIFNDITDNESVESLVIKAYKVSNIKDAEYSYKVVNSENIIEYIEKLESLVTDDKSGEMRSVYSKISASEYESIEKHIREGIEKYYEENSKKYYRLVRVDIKAIYCLRLKKIPIDLNLLVDNSVVAKMNTYYSMVSNDLNVFTCPNCNTMSSDLKNYDGMKIHIDHDFTNMEEDMLGVKMHIGCSDCMEQCPRCGRWHFKLTDYANVISKGFTPINKRVFLKNFANKNVSSESLCSCKEHLSWIYDEMSLVKKNGKTFYSNVVDKFLSGGCKLTFINYLTGESIASYSDYLRYLHAYLSSYLSTNKKILDLFSESKDVDIDDEGIKTRIFNFVDAYLTNDDHEFDGFQLESYIEQSIIDFKKGIADALNLPAAMIKATNALKCAKCSSCDALYYKEVNDAGELYYNLVKNFCGCCDEAANHRYTSWTRADDGVVFYKPMNRLEAVRTFQTGREEILFESWLEKIRAEQIRSLQKK